jgi:flagellar transcriptional activator FlhD
MNMQDLQADIKEANLTYLMLAQQMLRADRVGALYRLGINTEMADLLARLPAAQLVRMANTDMLLARFRLDERTVLGMLNDYSKDRPMSRTHSAIMLAAQPVAA